MARAERLRRPVTPSVLAAWPGRPRALLRSSQKAFPRNALSAQTFQIHECAEAAQGFDTDSLLAHEAATHGKHMPGGNSGGVLIALLRRAGSLVLRAWRSGRDARACDAAHASAGAGDERAESRRRGPAT